MKLGMLGHTESDLGQLEQLPTTLLQRKKTTNFSPLLSLPLHILVLLPSHVPAQGSPLYGPGRSQPPRQLELQPCATRPEAQTCLGSFTHSSIHLFTCYCLIWVVVVVLNFLYGSHSLDQASLKLTFQSRLACNF